MVWLGRFGVLEVWMAMDLGDDLTLAECAYCGGGLCLNDIEPDATDYRHGQCDEATSDAMSGIRWYLSEVLRRPDLLETVAIAEMANIVRDMVRASDDGEI